MALAVFAKLYRQLDLSLQQEKWFRQGWATTAGFFPNSEEPKSVFLQLFQDTWFNEAGKGIHFESWMTNADAARGTATVTLHIESSKERTGINGKVLVKSLFETAGGTIRSWPGYQIKESYTMQPFAAKISLTPDTFLQTLGTEFRRLEGIADSVSAAILEARK